MPKLLAEGREFAISDDAWNAWKGFARPFELPDEVLRRILGVAPNGRADGSAQTAVERSSPASTSLRSRRSGRADKAKRTRVPSELLLPEREYELPILEALMATGGRRPTREVVEAVGKALDARLTDVDREPVREGGDPRWHTRIQFARLRLVRSGLMKEDSPRGLWEITPAGEERAKEVRHG